MKKLTIKDVARAAGVSTTVVSKVINAPRRPDGTLDCPDTSRETAERVLKVVNELNYRPSRFAAGLRRGKRYVLGVITPDISNTAFSEGCRVIEDLAHRDGYTVMFGSSAENPQKMAELLDTFVANGVDGLIVIPCDACEESLRKVVSYRIPVVLSSRDIPSLEGVGRVFQDNRESIRQVIAHLISNGYSKIAMISENMNVSSLKDREISYRENMLAAGLEPMMWHADTPTLATQVAEFVKEAVALGTEAIIAPRMNITLSVLRTIKDLKLRIPEQIALVGHDESPLFTFYNPTISYISQTSDEVGRESYQMLQSMIAGNAPGTVLIAPEICFGESTSRRKQESLL